MPRLDFSWKCFCGMTKRKEPHRRLADHMEAAHHMVWSEEKQQYVLKTEVLKTESSREWRQYKRKGLSEMRPYVVGEDLSGVSISEADRAAGSPKEGDMIARNPQNHADQWLVARQYFQDNLEPA